MPGGQVGAKALPFGGSFGFYCQPLAFEHRIPGGNACFILRGRLRLGRVLQHIVWARHVVSYRSAILHNMGCVSNICCLIVGKHDGKQVGKVAPQHSSAK